MESSNKRRRIMVAGLAATIGIIFVATTRQYLDDKCNERKPWFGEDELLESPAVLVEKIVNCSNSNRCKTVLRVSPEQFRRLCELIAEVPTSKLLTTAVQLAVFLDWIATGKTVRVQRECWKISHEGLLICRRQVAAALFKALWTTYVLQPSAVPDLESAHKLRHFQGAFGCIDGCHFPIMPIRESTTRWRNRKGFLSTNVMAACDCTDSLLFTVVIVGAEGCGSDSTIFKHCAREINWLKHGFLLADAGYALSLRLLTPYRGVRYHLQEFGKANERPKNKEELFNLRHAQLRNYIERCFGVLKCRFQVLTRPLSMDHYDDMWTLIYSCFALHNFIRITDAGVDKEWEMEVMHKQLQQLNRDDLIGSEDDPLEAEDLVDEVNSSAAAWRNTLAERMWVDYKAVLRERGL